MDILLKNIKIVSPEDKINAAYDVLIENGIIKSIGKDIKTKDETRILDCAGKTAVPGFFDMHVHFREPGAEYKEDIESGIASAANGGFTGVLMMPNTNPPVSDKSVISFLKNRTQGKIVDAMISASITKNRKGGELNNIRECIEAGAAAFTDDGSVVASPEIMNKILALSSEYGFMVLQHAENPNLCDGGVINEGEVSEKLNLKGMPCLGEVSIVVQDIAIANKNKGSRYHLQHISCGKSCEIIRDERITNKNITAEACPHHFILTDEAVVTQGSNAKMNPPLRLQSDIDKIIEGLKDGSISVICTDHAPHSAEEKNKPVENSPFGIVGLETSIALSYTHLVENGNITFEKLIYLMSVNPRSLLNLPVIRFAEGEKANITILDTNASWTIDKNKFKSKSRNTPFDSFKVTCKPFAVINNNQIYFSDL